jgi:hypothetical protein
MNKLFSNKLLTANFGFTLFLLIFQICVMSFETRAQSCAPAPVGLVAWYSGDNNALDSRSRNNGTLLDGATFVSGNVGQAFQFVPNQRVLAPDSASLDLTNAVTIETWISPQQFGGAGNNSSVVLKGSIGGASGESYSLMFFSNGSAALRLSNGSTIEQLFSAAILPLNTFSHIVGTYDGTTMKFYVNGVLTNSAVSSLGPLNNSAGPMLIGSNGIGPYDGKLDEVSIYNRALTQDEITAIFNAGTAGKCKPTATVAPSGQVSWFAGDGNALDSASPNNGTLQNGAGFAVGKVGQGFSFDGSNDFVSFGDPANLKFTNTDFTVEGWFMIPDLPNNPGSQCGARYPIFGYDFGYTVEIGGDGRLRFRKSTSPANAVGFGTLNPLATNVFHHFAAIHTPTEMRLYVDGMLDNTLPISDGTVFYSGGDFPEMGRFGCGTSGVVDFFFKGKIDEASIYSRALTATEVGSIFNAGIAGKLKDNTTATGSNVAVSTKSDATVTFPTVSTAGITQQIPLDLSTLPNLPIGSTTTGLTSDIATTAVFTGSPQVCFNLPSITNSTIFNNLRILHLENNVWTNRTDLASINFPTNTICTSGLTSLSPFAVVNGFAPTAALVSVGGRVLNSNGRAIYRARISMIDMNGENRTAIANQFGYFRFNGVRIGETYVFNILSKEHQFQTQIINVTDEIANLNFTALP